MENLNEKIVELLNRRLAIADVKLMEEVKLRCELLSLRCDSSELCGALKMAQRLNPNCAELNHVVEHAKQLFPHLFKESIDTE